MMRGHSVHLRGESGRALDQRMPFVQCLEHTLTLPMYARPRDNRRAP